MRKAIRFLRRGKVVTLDNLDHATVLDYLRRAEGSTGAKPACGTGDCGACTVALGRRRGDKIQYETAMACITPIGLADGAEIVAPEDIAGRSGELHPVQRALVEKEATPCGYCAPGVAMSLFALHHGPRRKPDRAAVAEALSGNLCRCSGYRAMIEAGHEACQSPPTDRHAVATAETLSKLRELADGEDLMIGDADRFFAAPAKLDTLLLLLGEHPDATLIAGGTGLAASGPASEPWPRKLVHIARVPRLDRIEDTGPDILFGPAVSLALAASHLAAIDPDIGALVRRVGGPQLRSLATIGGNLLTSPQNADLPPPLIALGATLELRRGGSVRAVPLDEFYRPDGSRDLKPGEIVTGVMVPKLSGPQLFRCYRVAKRRDNDRAVVVGAFRFDLEGGRIIEARVAYSGVGPAPMRAARAEEALTGISLADSRAWAKAFKAVRSDVAVPSDEQSATRYRSDLAHALLGKALIEGAGANTGRTRLADHREAAANAAL